MLLAFCLLAVFFNYEAQVNYVINPSFEKVDSCPVYVSKVKAIGWDTLMNGGGYNPDLMTNCYTNTFVTAIVGVPLNLNGTSYQQPRTGNNYYNIFSYQPVVGTEQRDYLQGTFNKTLPKKNYCVTFYTNLSNNSKFAIDRIGAVIDDGAIKAPPGQATLVPTSIASPSGTFISDTMNWVKVQGVYSAIGNETKITLGNFNLKNTTNSIVVNPTSIYEYALYFFDDVSVIEADLPAYAGRDTVLCLGDSVFLGRPPEIGLECLWFNGGSQIGKGGGLWVKPATTQTYMVQQDVCGLIKTSTIQVQIKPNYIGTTTLNANFTSACLADTVKLNVINPPLGTKINYYWLPNTILTNTTNLTAKTFIKESTLFTSIISSSGQDAFCPFTLTNTIQVVIPDSCFKDPLIPNIFTPNNDDVNDVWRIKFPYGFKLNQLCIYNRWGTLLYDQTNLSFNVQNLASIIWDGRTTSGEECNAGIYFYLISYLDKNGVTKMVKGNVSLIK